MRTLHANPKFRPRGGGEECKGDNPGRIMVSICKLRPCSPSVDPRLEACETRYGQSTSYKQITPAAPQRGANECQLQCNRIARNGRPELLDTQRIVPEGTPCSYDDPHSYCLLGKCYHVGCDTVINSGKRFNDCGVCGGSHADCDYERQSKDKINKSVGRKFLI